VAAHTPNYLCIRQRPQIIQALKPGAMQLLYERLK
jgi:hypothetical protein